MKERQQHYCVKCPRLFYSMGKQKQRLCHPHWKREMGFVPANVPIQPRTKLGTKCQQAGCDRQPIAKRLCWTHYQRKRFGVPANLPMKRKGPEKLGDEVSAMRMAPYAMVALRRRAKAAGVPINAIVRALVEKWAMTDGAELKPVLNARRTDIAWARGDSEMNRDH